MPAPTTQERLAKVHERALVRFTRVHAALRDERLQCLQDRRFYSIPGAQWEGALGEQFENKPKFEVNKVHLAVLRIINEYRNNRITVDFQPKSDAEDADRLADTCDGLHRAGEKESCAEEARDNAFEEAVGGGMGAWRLRACLENEDDPTDARQRIEWDPIFDADARVFFDDNSRRQDKSDAKWCFVLTPMAREAYVEEYGDDPAEWPAAVTQSEFDWATVDQVFLAEYFEVELKPVTVQTWRTLSGEEERYTSDDFADDDELLERLLAVGSRMVAERKVKRRRVHKYLMSGAKALEDCGLIAGPNIPVVVTYGKRWVVDGVERCMGHVRLARDAQRLKNMQLSKLGEISALSSVEKPILTPAQIAGHTQMWSEDNVVSYPYLLLNPTIDPVSGQVLPPQPVAYTKVPQIPPAMAALLQITEQDMADILGANKDAEKMVSNIGHKTVEMIQQRLDMQTFIYVSNFAKALKREGQIWLGMARELFVEKGRKLKAIASDGRPQTIELLKPAADRKTGATDLDNDLSRADFEVNVEVGPSSTSRRAATVRSLTGMMAITQDPETLAVLSALTLTNMEGEGLADVRGYFRKKLLRLGAVEPTEEEKAELSAEQQGKPEDPQATYLRAAADQATAAATKARADTVLAIAKAGEAKANTADTLAGIDRSDQAHVVDVVQRLTETPAPSGAPATVQP